MNDIFLERAAAYSSAALKLLKRGDIPPTPQYFELFYTYYSGSNAALNLKMNKLLRKGKTPTTPVAESLYSEFLQSSSVSERLNVVSTEMTSRMAELRGSVDVATQEAFDYSDLLVLTIDELGEQHSKDEIADMAKSLLKRTRQMNDVNLTLGSNLEKAREDIDALKIEIENVRKESMIDPLTQIPNRKAFDFSLDLALKSSERNGDKLSLMLLDIDHFKAFNDNHGHQTGDQVLKLVAGALNKRAKGDYVAARYGGEEFGIVMPGACLEDATQTAEYLRKTIGERELHNKVTQEPLGRITASFGVADYRDGDTASTLIERADKCLYRAKKNGRDIVVNADHMAMSTASQQAQKSA